VFVVTSPDLLLGGFAYKDGYQHLKRGLDINGALHFVPGRGQAVKSVGDWFALQGSRVPVVSVHDGEAGLLDNIGAIVGVKQESLAVRKTSKSGTTWDIFHLHGIDAEGIFGAAERILKDAAEETFEVSAHVLEAVANRQTGGEVAYRAPGSYGVQ
jgi:pyruvate dehydrogenase E1 component